MRKELGEHRSPLEMRDALLLAGKKYSPAWFRVAACGASTPPLHPASRLAPLHWHRVAAMTQSAERVSRLFAQSEAGQGRAGGRARLWLILGWPRKCLLSRCLDPYQAAPAATFWGSSLQVTLKYEAE